MFAGEQADAAFRARSVVPTPIRHRHGKRERPRPAARVMLVLACLFSAADASAQIKPFGFLPPPLQDVGTEPQSIVSADFNGDGTPDLAIRDNFSAGQPCILVRLGNGDGTLTPGPPSADFGACGGELFAADFNSDGRADLAAVGLDRVYLAMGNGDGSFQAHVEHVLAATFPLFGGMAAGDVNGDGRTDLIVTGAEGDGPGRIAAIRLMLGNGDGTFAESLAYSLVIGSMGGAGFVQLFDVNGDGDLDAYVDFVTVGSKFFLGNGDGTFAAPIDAPLVEGAVASGYFNGDGHLDLAMGRASSPSPAMTQAVRILLGNGDGTFAAPVDYEGGGRWAMVAADFDQDGILDLAFNSSTSAAGVNGGNVGVLLGLGDGTFQAPPLVFSVIPIPTVARMVTADFNGDARPDIALILAEGIPPDHAILLNVQSQFTGSPPSITGAGVVTASIVDGAGCEFSAAQVIPLTGHPDSPPAGSAPPGLAFPLGLLDFTVTGCTPGASMTIQVDYSFNLPFGVQYWKYGPTSGNPSPHWYAIPHVQTGPRTLRFTIVDGGLGDDDLAANGTIVDAGGPGVPLPQPVPANGPIGIALLMLAVMAAGRLALGRGAMRG